MKIKKNQRRKKFHTTYNRKRMRNKQHKAGDIPWYSPHNRSATVNAYKCTGLVPDLLCIHCYDKVLKESWDIKKSVVRNLKEMGLANDPNKVIKIPNFKSEQVRRACRMVAEEPEEEVTCKTTTPVKIKVMQQLEADANAPRQRKFMLPKGQVELITYFLDKYAHDYKAMVKDKKNYNQETWKQLRAKIKTFMGIPKQYGEYLKERGLLDQEDNEEELRKQAKAMVMDDGE